MKKKKSRISVMVNKIEAENEQYITRHKHVLKGYIENEEKDILDENEENIKFLKDTKGIFLKEDENDLDIDMEQLSIASTKKNYLIKLFNFLLPFNGDIKFIKENYNTTVLLAFKIYRFILLMSIFTAVIFLALLFLHIIEVKNDIGKLCKYGFPCFLFYSSFQQSEALNMSVTYGVWIMFYFICTMIYYFLLSSENNRQELYFQNNKYYAGCSYLFSSWNFNNKNEKISDKSKQAIKDELENYTENYISQLDGKKEKKCNICFMTLAHIAYIVYLVISFFIIIFFFYLTEKMRSRNKIIPKLEAGDIIADIITYLLIGIFLYIIVWFTGFFPKFEGWSQEKQKHSSEAMKKIITTIIIIISLIFIVSYFTFYSNENKKILPFLDVEITPFYGCPGKFEDHRHDLKLSNIINNYDLISRKSYSQCKEEDVGITYFFIFLVYFIVLFLTEILKSIINCFCLCMEKPTYRPSINIIKFLSANILFLIVIYYIPFFAILYPIIVFILYKFEIFILKKRGAFSYKEMGINHRNNKFLILNSFIFYNLAVFCIIGYFYFAPLPHSYQADCYTPKEVVDNSINILLYNSLNYCGPVRAKTKLSSILTNKMKDINIIGWNISLFQQLPFIIILISFVLIILIYRQYYPDKRYYKYIFKRHKDLLNTFYVLYEQISKRDVLTSMLLKITQQKLK